MTQSTSGELEQRMRDTFTAAEVITQRWSENEASHEGQDTPKVLATRGDSATPQRARRRFTAPLAAAAAVLVVAGVAVSLAAIRGGSGQSSGAPSVAARASKVASAAPSSAASTTSVLTSVREPAWVKRCIRPANKQVSEYVGLTLVQARSLAAQHGDTLMGYAADGQCQGHLAIYVANPVAIAVTGANTQLSNPAQIRVVYAARVDPATGQ